MDSANLSCVTIGLFLLILVVSFALPVFFVSRDAKRFAVAPPTPLLDLDRMYDVIFERLDEATSNAVTPDELTKILAGFIRELGSRDLIQEDIAPENEPDVDETFSAEKFATAIMRSDKDLDVTRSAVENVVELSFTYLHEINALT